MISRRAGDRDVEESLEVLALAGHEHRDLPVRLVVDEVEDHGRLAALEGVGGARAYLELELVLTDEQVDQLRLRPVGRGDQDPRVAAGDLGSLLQEQHLGDIDTGGR